MGQANHKIVDTEGNAARSENNPGTETAEKKRGRGRPRKSEPGSEQREPETAANVPRVVLVETPDLPEAEEKQEKKQQPRRKRKDVQFELKKEQVTVLIKTCFDIAASREGLELWKLSQKEAELIGEPLAALLNKNPVIGTVTGKYGDAIALIVAAATVLMPRIMLQIATRPKTKKGVKPYAAISQFNGKPKNASNGSSSGNENGTNGSSNMQPIKQPAEARANFSGKLSNVIPSIQ